MKLLIDKTFVLDLNFLKSTLKSNLSHSLLNMNSMFKWELNQIQCCIKKNIIDKAVHTSCPNSAVLLQTLSSLLRETSSTQKNIAPAGGFPITHPRQGEETLITFS